MIREWNEESLDHRNTLLYAMGISEEDAKRPIIGLVNTWNEMNPGHYPFDKALIAEMKEEIYKLGGLALELPISGICDGICSNTPGDRYTLPAHEIDTTEEETLDELNKIQTEGRAKRVAAEQELTRIEDELKQKMMEIRS